MKHPNFLIKAVLAVACLLCTMSAMSQEAYVCFTPEDSTMTFYYDNLKSSRPGTIYSMGTGAYSRVWNNATTQTGVAQVVFDPSFADARPTSTSQWFDDFRNMRTITGMEYLNMSQVTSVSWMFCDCNKLESIDLSHFETDRATSLNRLFMSCKSLRSIDLSNFNTENVTDMAYMFAGCEKLETRLPRSITTKTGTPSVY